MEGKAGREEEEEERIVPLELIITASDAQLLQVTSDSAKENKQRDRDEEEDGQGYSQGDRWRDG